MIQIHRNAADQWRIRLAPDRSLDWRSARRLFVAMAAGCLAISGFFAFRGLWLPLPFAGIEVLTLGYCWYRVLRSGQRVETIDVTPRRVKITADEGSGTRQRGEFHPLWVKVELAAGAFRGYPRRLLLSSHGRRLEVGKFLTDRERKQLFGELTATLSAVRI